MACQTLPAVSFEDCNGVSLLHGEIKEIRFTNIGNPLTDVTDGTEWGTRLDDSTATDTLIRTLKVRGDKPIAGSNAVNRAGNLKSFGPRTQVINFDLDDLSDANYDAARSMQKLPNWLFWYVDNDGYVYGGNSGITGSFDLGHQIPREQQDGQTIQGVISWEDRQDPERDTDPV